MIAPLLSLLALTVTLFACSSSKSSGGSDDLEHRDANAITTIYKEAGHFSVRIESQMTVVVNSQEDLVAMWDLVFADHSPTPRMPEVDFARESVVMATMGLKSSGGYGVSISALEEIPEGMRLIIDAESPGSGCMTTQALTTPVHIVRTRKLPGVVLFDLREKIVACD